MNVRLLLDRFERDLIFATVTFVQFFGCYRFNDFNVVGGGHRPLRNGRNGEF